MDNTKKQFTERVRSLRNRKYYTQHALANLCRVSQSEISRIESGRYKDIRVKTIISLARAFEVDPDELVRATEFASVVAHGATLLNPPPDSGTPYRLPSVFISYRQTDDYHRQLVRILRELLRESGISVVLDQFVLDDNPEAPNEGWADWSSDRAHDTDYALIVGTYDWFRYFDKKQFPETGLGAACETEWSAADLICANH